MNRTINAFVSRLNAHPIEVTEYGDDSPRFIAGIENSVEVHTGLGTFDLPWPLDEMPPIGATVLLTIEVPEP